MSEDDWIKRRVAEAKSDRPLVTVAVLTRIDELLRGQLSDAQISRGQLTTLAGDLLAKMGSESTKSEADR